MPLVEVRYKGDRVSGGHIRNLVRNVLPLEVAKALHIEEHSDAHLVPGDIEVWVNTTGGFDVQAQDVAIVIHATDFEPRRARLKVATAQVAAAVKEALPLGLTGYVWILLSPAEFVEFGKK
ncbi:MAG: hypothetical protein A2842_01845 [Candidatus Wildermuthbacteria bacterium RIFCSPHIGHO2_01_FULL_48_25]|uniref:4-oxalocrotonate tautomerase domain-containing protein n=1 Tax=Candidatus Wildermuthbacteria bacterium RIFCSPLOWO2_01_FULL_48_16 TaxID=1802461 RepID=A0A1G2RM23_9BACT|nr:MAG: hypothetical protein A2842_01845 [Candidatus Wildermuthbacteria bacterium RIFCSPHIGHO2_01_FULL_48_25]OHA68555.1 MAG: hypothetical protein A3J57_00180 [Candidatus Wildermuthbacteria bacterium RIFCSPHIGHO2_02_FULL_49_12b]OHA73419.1 MAG: hypothetical protein A3B24_02310 [Candidatus Wildermuthbacteria bacterium RIFCSPLOWO2_01_FULL_48_16]